MSDTATAVRPADRRRTGPRPPVSREKARARRDARSAWTLLAPSLIILGVMVAYPAVLMVIQSFTDYTVRNKVQGTMPNFVGFAPAYALSLPPACVAPARGFTRTPTARPDANRPTRSSWLSRSTFR